MCTKHRKTVQIYKIKSIIDRVSQGILQLGIFLEYLKHIGELDGLDALVTPSVSLSISDLKADESEKVLCRAALF